MAFKTWQFCPWLTILKIPIFHIDFYLRSVRETDLSGAHPEPRNKPFDCSPSVVLKTVTKRAYCLKGKYSKCLTSFCETLRLKISLALGHTQKNWLLFRTKKCRMVIGHTICHVLFTQSSGQSLRYFYGCEYMVNSTGYYYPRRSRKVFKIPIEF